MRYPVLNSRRSFIECPTHKLAVALGDDGRIVSARPRCKRDAANARRRLTRKRRAS